MTNTALPDAVAATPQSTPRPAAFAHSPAPARPRHRTTTFSCLTSLATDALEQALVEAGPGGQEPGWLTEAHAAHQDLTHALAHLGATLLGLGTVPALAAARPSGPVGSDRRLVMLLARRACLHDWEQPTAEAGTVADLIGRSARIIRAAADLWSTHHTALGIPRSPEASRMRHPAMLGKAVREWRGLVVGAAAMADQLAHHSRTTGRRGAEYRDLTGYPVPQQHRTAERGDVVDLTVARPARRRAGDPLTGIVERTSELRAVAWRMAEAGMAPVDLLANAVAIGTMLATAAERASRAAALSDLAGAAAHERRAESAIAQAHAWQAIGPMLTNLRSPLPPSAVLVSERRDLAALLDRVTAPALLDPRAVETAQTLSLASQRFTEVAGYLETAVRRARGRRAMLMSGRALTHLMVQKRAKLLDAKLRDEVVVAPDRIVVTIERALRAAAATGSGPDLARTSG